MPQPAAASAVAAEGPAVRRRLAPPAPSHPGSWGSLNEPLLLLVMHSLGPTDIAAAHLVARGWRDAARLATRALRFAGQPPDTERIKQTFPRLAELSLERMQLPKQALACVAGLTGLSSLSLRVCRLGEAGSIAALQGLSSLQELELCDVLGPSSEELDDAIRGLRNLHRLHVESESAACKAPSLRSLAFLPRIRQLSVKQARARHSFVGLTNLAALLDLQALELKGATVTNSIVARLAELTGLTQLRVPEALLVTDHGIEALSGLTALRELDLSCWGMQADGPVSDAGVAHLAPLGLLTSLSLAGRGPVTAQGLAFLGGFTGLQSLDLSRVQLDHGSAAFLWHLTRLTVLRLGGTKMEAAQFDGLAALRRLSELDVSGSQFDDACCASLDAMPDLQQVNVSNTPVGSDGLLRISGAHPGRLSRLQLNGCRVSMRALLRVLRCQPGGVILWDPSLRGHMPRWCNLANSLLMAAPPGQRQHLRLCIAPEATWPCQAGMTALVAAMFVGYSGLLLATLVVLLLLPLAGIFLGGGLLAMKACGRSPPASAILRAAAHGEVHLSAVLVGVLSVEVPPPPPPADPHL